LRSRETWSPGLGNQTDVDRLPNALEASLRFGVASVLPEAPLADAIQAMAQYPLAPARFRKYLGAVLGPPERDMALLEQAAETEDPGVAAVVARRLH
jgi:hypothetical protein